MGAKESLTILWRERRITRSKYSVEKNGPIDLNNNNVRGRLFPLSETGITIELPNGARKSRSENIRKERTNTQRVVGGSQERDKPSTGQPGESDLDVIMNTIKVRSKQCK